MFNREFYGIAVDEEFHRLWLVWTREYDNTPLTMSMFDIAANGTLTYVEQSLVDSNPNSKFLSLAVRRGVTAVAYTPASNPNQKNVLAKYLPTGGVVAHVTGLPYSPSLYPTARETLAISPKPGAERIFVASNRNASHASGKVVEVNSGNQGIVAESRGVVWSAAATTLGHSIEAKRWTVSEVGDLTLDRSSSVNAGWVETRGVIGLDGDGTAFVGHTFSPIVTTLTPDGDLATGMSFTLSSPLRQVLSGSGTLLFIQEDGSVEWGRL